jgi:hypothetical protein
MGVRGLASGRIDKQDGTCAAFPFALSEDVMLALLRRVCCLLALLALGPGSVLFAQEPAPPAEPPPAEPAPKPEPMPMVKPPANPNEPGTAIVPRSPLGAPALAGALAQLKPLRVTHLKAAEAEQLLSQVLGAGSSFATLASTYAPAASSGGPPPSIAADDRAKTVFIRGTKEEVADAEAVLAAYDRPREAWQSGEFTGTLVLPVQHAGVQRVTQILAKLKLPATSVAFGTQGLIVVRGGGPEINAQVTEVVKALDIPDLPPPPKAEPPKAEPKPDTPKVDPPK